MLPNPGVEVPANYNVAAVAPLGDVIYQVFKLPF